MILSERSVTFQDLVVTPEDGAAVLIAASSGRALAAAARRSGYRPLVADLFDDEDTRSLCAGNRLAGDPRTGFDDEALMLALGELAETHSPVGFVYGPGFEDRIDLLDEIARRWPLFGNQPQTVRSVKDPAALARLCAFFSVSHPKISLTKPENPDGWLVKSVGGAGGGHVAPARAWRATSENVYFQRAAPGAPVSILCLCNGIDAIALGTSAQWASPTPDEPFRFGGCARPAKVSAQIESRMAAAALSLARGVKLIGLNSFDFLVDGEAFTLIEINPRPGATLDIFEDRRGLLFQAHISACLGLLPVASLEFEGAAAAAIAYAQKEIAQMPALDWPQWAADQQKSGSALGLYDPLCTIKASAAEPATARDLVEERTALILEKIDDLGTGATS